MQMREWAILSAMQKLGRARACFSRPVGDNGGGCQRVVQQVSKKMLLFYPAATSPDLCPGHGGKVHLASPKGCHSRLFLSIRATFTETAAGRVLVRAISIV